MQPLGAAIEGLKGGLCRGWPMGMLHGDAPRAAGAEQDWAGLGSACGAWGQLGVPGKPLWSTACAGTRPRSILGPLCREGLCLLQGLRNHLTAGMRGSCSRRSSHTAASAFTGILLLLFISKARGPGGGHATWAVRPHGALSRSRLCCRHSTAGACDRAMAIAWGHLIQRPLEETENLQLTSRLASNPHFQPVPRFHFSSWVRGSSQTGDAQR